MGPLEIAEIPMKLCVHRGGNLQFKNSEFNNIQLLQTLEKKYLLMNHNFPYSLGKCRIFLILLSPPI